MLKGRIHDIATVAEHGGIIHVSELGSTMKGIEEMLNQLQTKSIHGFLIDRNTYYHLSNRVKENKYKHIAKKLKDMDLLKTEIIPSGGLSCGMLIKEWSDYVYFKGHFDSNRVSVNSCNLIRMNVRQIDVKGESDMSFDDNSVFDSLLKYTLFVCGAILVLGLLCEMKRYCNEKRLACRSSTKE